MLPLLVSMMAGQVALPPLTTDPFQFGEPTLQPYAGELAEGWLAFSADGGFGEAVWIDSRRLSGFGPVTSGRGDLWIGSFPDRTSGLLEPVPDDSMLHSPRIAFNQSRRAIAWIESNGSTSVVVTRSWTGTLEEPRRPPRSAQPASKGLALVPHEQGFLMAWAGPGGLLQFEAIPQNSVPPPPTSVVPSGRIELASLPSGAILLGVETPLGPTIGRFEQGWIGWRTFQSHTLVGISGRLERIATISTSSQSLALQGHEGGALFLTVGAINAMASSDRASTAFTHASATTGLRTFGFVDPNGTTNGQTVAKGPSMVAVATLAPLGAALSVNPEVLVHPFLDRATIIVLPPVPLSQALPITRFPSVVWHAPLQAFVVAWDERTVTGAGEAWSGKLGLLQSSSPPSIRGQTVSGPTGASQGLQAIQLSPHLGGLTRVTAPFEFHSLDASVLGMPLASIVGAGWRASAGTPFAAYRPAAGPGFQVWTRTSAWSVPGSVPRCAAEVGGAHYFPTWNGSELKLFAVLGDGGSASVGPVQVPPAGDGGLVGELCLTRSARLSEAVLSWREGNVVRALAVDVRNPGAVLDRREALLVRPGEPIAVGLESGIVMAVVENTPLSPAGVAGSSQVLLAVPGTRSLLALNGGGGLARFPQLAIGPNQTIAVVWQEFTTDAGSTRVFGRMLTLGIDGGTTDGGLGSDGGPDGGSDGGLVPPLDGGEDAGFDSGVSDAGRPDVDAGLLPDGGVDSGPVIFQPSCGCSTDLQVSWAVGLALLFLRRRRRPHHPC